MSDQANDGSKRSSPKGLYVNLPPELKVEIEARCKESYRTPGAEIAWIVRDWLQKNDPKPQSARVGTIGDQV